MPDFLNGVTRQELARILPRYALTPEPTRNTPPSQVTRGGKALARARSFTALRVRLALQVLDTSDTSAGFLKRGVLQGYAQVRLGLL